MDLRIFLSSTHDDLEEARQKILRLLSVLPADLVHMETFGSDETKPVDFCMQQVRGSNLFVGVYAERYGTVDPSSGRSITELEYREAAAMLRRGELLALLVYILDPAASWRVEFVDREQANVEALARLKGELKENHTIVFFKDSEELSLQVLRDVLRKVGVGAGEVFRPRPTVTALGTQREGPLGMEHYTERDATIFRGREDAVAGVVRLLESSPIALLIGDSGIGKTSLIQAGVFPTLRARGWAVASSRPLDNPDESIPGTLWGQLMEGLPPAAALGTALELMADAHRMRSVLVVIDQLEDIISSFGTAKVSNLLAALTQIHASSPQNLHMLLSYRGDAEPKVGRYWQTISGSASGLPRYYLQPLGTEGAISALREMLRPVLPSPGTPNSSGFFGEIISDLEVENIRSVGLPIYPPFLQMIAEVIFKTARDSSVPADIALYRSLGGAREIIGRYLGSRLSLLGPRAKESRAVLVSLAAPARRLRKSSTEISIDTSLAEEAVDACLADLVSLRLVHAVGTSWEITHDFLAQKVIEDLVAPEERGARVFRDVLSAKAAAFRSTGEILSVKEHLGVYAHRSQITPTRDEAELLFVSHLAGNGPVRYFLRGIEPSVARAWARQYLTSSGEMIKQNAHRYSIRCGVKFTLGVLAEVFSDHKLQAELAQYVKRYATKDDIQLLLRLRRKKAELTREAAYRQLEILVDPSDVKVRHTLIRSAKPSDIRLSCRILITHARAGRLSNYRAELHERSLANRIAAACGLGAVGTQADISDLFQRISKRDLSPTGREVISYAIAYWAQDKKQPAILRRLLDGPKTVCRGAISALEGDRAGMSLEFYLKSIPRHPLK